MLAKSTREFPKICFQLFNLAFVFPDLLVEYLSKTSNLTGLDGPIDYATVNREFVDARTGLFKVFKTSTQRLTIRAYKNGKYRLIYI